MTNSPSPLSFQHIEAELRLFCGDDSLVALARELKRAGCKRAVVVSGRSVGASGLMGLLRDALGSVLAGESHAVRSNSPVPAVEEVTRVLETTRADAVIAIGGGSAAVTARAASILLAEQRPAAELCTRRLPSGEFDSPRLNAAKLPQFIVPTTPSTAFVKAGSAVHDPATGERLALFDPKTRVKAIFLHAGFLRTSPAELVRSASLNTLANAVEALESANCDPLSEALLLHATRLLARHLKLVDDDRGARERLAMAAILCGRGTEVAGGGLASVLAHAIGHRSHTANGIINAIVLPHTMRFNAPATVSRAASLADGLGGSGSPTTAIEAVLADLPIPRRLRDIGLQQDELTQVADAAMSDFFIKRNARLVTGAADILGILKAAW